MIGGGRGGGGARQHNLGDSKAQFSSSGAKGVQGAATPSWSPGWAKQSPGHTNTKTTPPFPLSPPLEPLRPFCPPVGPQLLPQLLLQAQYHQLLSRHQQLAAPAPAPAPLLPEPHEYLQRLLALRQEMGLGPAPEQQQGEHKLGKVEVVQPAHAQEAEEPPASPPRMEETIKQEPSKTEKTENGFHVADSIKHSFRDPQHFELIRNMIEGVNKTTTKQMFGEQMGEGVSSPAAGLKQEWDADDDQCDESIASEDGQGSAAQDDRKVRVRTLISEEQSLVLKTHYQMNPRPKREELDNIARKIGHPFKVVKVWFQNARARDRREGKNLPHLPFPSPGLGHAHPPFLNNNFQFGAGLPRLPLPFMRPGLAAEHFNKLNPALFPFSSLHQGGGGGLGAGRAESKSPDSIKSDNITDEMEEEEEDCEAPLDLSNKGSTPGASPVRDTATEEQLQLSRLSGPVSPVVNFSKLGASFSSPGLAPAHSSDEEAADTAATCPQDNCAKVFSNKSSLNRHLLDHKGNQ